MSTNPSLIVTTYNWPEALELVLVSIQLQTVMPCEVIVADDGSDQRTANLLAKMKPEFPCPLHHVWQTDNGFQAAKIRNKAASISSGNYLVFTDGDCILRPDFILSHKKLAQEKYFVAGNRVLLSPQFTSTVLEKKMNIGDWKPGQFQKDDINRPWALLRIPQGFLRTLQKNRWKGVKTCNLSMSKQALVDVNGFDENFHGWGYEDSDLVIRLLHRGYQYLNGKFSTTVLHLWHHENDRRQEGNNWKQLMAVKNSHKYFSEKGIDQYRHSRIEDFKPDFLV
ncbi:MAG TPA: glycosyltransferase [Chromatiales bacterium]|nr:glycosyltransferase [Thiotrichales bacterium]HIP67708.1 glycosyltransferase [Chromatiales bacterium]